MDVLRVIKINILALIAFPLLMVATVVKLVAKAMEKLITIIGTIIIIAGLALVFELAKNPGEFFQGLVMFIVIFVIGGIFTAMIVWILSIISGILMGGVALIIGVVNAIYELVYAGYAGLYHVCYEDYCKLGMSRGTKIGSCFIYSFLRVFNRIIIFFASHAIKLLVLLSIVIVVGSFAKSTTYIQATFGLGLWEYLGMFSLYEIIYGVVLYVAVLAGIVILLVSLGIEWSEWGSEMSLSTSDYERYVKSVMEGYTDMNAARLTDISDADNKRIEKCNHYMDLLNLHISSFEDFLQETQSVAERSEDHILRANHGQYVTDLHEIIERLNSFGEQMPLEEFEKVIPHIQQVDDLKRKIEQQVAHIREAKEKRAQGGSFFAGCDTREKLDKRYKALCKTYHPDSEAGDEETFKRMRDEYEALKKTMEMSE